MSNLFAAFSPQAILNMPLNWVRLSIPIILRFSSPWVAGSTILCAINNLLKWIKNELIPLVKSFSLHRITLVSLSLFWVIILFNISGLVPFVFTPSSHASINLSLALPLWAGHIILALIKQPISCATHLVPRGAPAPLLPILVIIELISSIIRPLTLTVRLTANIIAGHLLLTLVGGGARSPLSLISILVISGRIALIILESAVACIQAYVFTVLSTLYLEEVNSSNIIF